MITETLEKNKNQEIFQNGDQVRLPEDSAWPGYEGVVVGSEKNRGKTYIEVAIQYQRKDTGEMKTYKPKFRPERLERINEN